MSNVSNSLLVEKFSGIRCNQKSLKQRFEIWRTIIEACMQITLFFFENPIFWYPSCTTKKIQNLEEYS